MRYLLTPNVAGSIHYHLVPQQHLPSWPLDNQCLIPRLCSPAHKRQHCQTQYGTLQNCRDNLTTQDNLTAHSGPIQQSSQCQARKVTDSEWGWPLLRRGCWDRPGRSVPQLDWEWKYASRNRWYSQQLLDFLYNNYVNLWYSLVSQQITTTKHRIWLQDFSTTCQILESLCSYDLGLADYQRTELGAMLKFKRSSLVSIPTMWGTWMSMHGNLS